jgi:glycosyltransferase involved in cell wall biosynthesis
MLRIGLKQIVVTLNDRHLKYNKSAVIFLTIINLMSPAISLITVVRDDLEGLKITAKSIVSQNFDGFEWLIVDGFSTDGTWEYAQKLKSHPFVSLSQTTPKGIYEAMNCGARQSSGTWLWFINAGDVLLGDHILKEMAGIAKVNADVSIIASPVVYLTPSQRYYSLSIPKVIVRESSKYAIFHHQGCILNGVIFSQVGGFDETLRFAADGKLIDSMISISDSAIVPTVAVGFEMGGATSKNFWHSLNEIRIYRQQVLTKRGMVFYQIKETFRSLMLKIDKTSIGRSWLAPYLQKREKSILDSAKLMGLEMPRQHRVIG